MSKKAKKTTRRIRLSDADHVTGIDDRSLRAPYHATSASDEIADGKDGLNRLADLTRKVVAVPKSEIPPDTRKQPDPHAD